MEGKENLLWFNYLSHVWKIVLHPKKDIKISVTSLKNVYAVLAKKIKEEAGLQGQHLDIGFRVYKLDSSNLRVWNPDADNLELALGSHEKHLLPGRTQEDLLYEILLKQGIELTEDARIRELGGKRVYSLGHGQYYACMETVIPSDQIESLALGIVQWKNEESPDNTQCAVFVIDEAFRSDADKLNFAKILEQHGIPSVKAL